MSLKEVWIFFDGLFRLQFHLLGIAKLFEAVGVVDKDLRVRVVRILVLSFYTLLDRGMIHLR